MSAEVRLLPPNDGPVVCLYVWIGIWRDGRESILSADLPLPGIGMRHMPLMSGKRDVAESLRPLAFQLRAASRQSADPMHDVELRTFCVATS